MIKKILAIFIACILCFPGISSFSKDAQASYDRDIELVRSLEIMRGYEDGSFGGEKNVTRMEYTAVIVRLLGYESQTSEYRDSAFSDVSAESWGNGYVSLAHAYKIVDGTGDGTFSPQANVTFNQAVKILVSAMGYKLMAEAKGGYPSGYINVANSLHITNGVGNGDTALTRGQVAKLIANSLDAKIAREDSFNSDGDYTMVQSDETLLESLDFYKKEGVVTAVYGANTTNTNADLEKNQIMIGDELYTTKIEDCTGFILKRVQYYGKETQSGADEVYFIQEISYGQNELVIDAENIDEDSTDLSKIKYLKGKRWTMQPLPGELVIVYNGKLVNSSDYSDSLIKPKSGVVVLIDEDRDNSYEYAVVTAYENYVVEAVNLPKIYDMFSKVLNLDEEDEISSNIYYKGMKVNAEFIQTGDVLSVAKSLDGKSVRVEIERESFSGYVDSVIIDDVDNIYYLIEGTEYSFAENYLRAYVENSSKLKKLSSGDSAVFYIDAFGKIAASEPISIDKSGFYGYLLDIEAARFGVSRVEIMTVNNKFEIFDLAEKVYFGRNVGNSYSTKKVYPTEIAEELKTDEIVEMQMIKYCLDSEGRINRLYLADKNSFSENFSLDVSRNTHFYSNGVYDGQYVLNNDTSWFDIPESGLYTDLFSAGYAPDFLRSNTSYTLELYDVEDGVAKAVYCKSTSPRYITYDTKVIVDKVNSPVMLIDKVRYTEIDGETRMCVSGYVDSRYVTVPVSYELEEKTDSKKDLKKGTIIQYETNYADINRAETSDELEVMWVYNVLHDFNITTRGLYRMWENTYIESNNAGIGTIFGVVTDVSFPYFTVSYNDENGNEKSATLQIGTQTQTYSYDRNGSIWKETDQREVQLGEILFIRTRYNRIREIVILKN